LSIKERRIRLETAMPLIMDSLREQITSVKFRLQYKEISPRDLKILELYREGLTLENIAKTMSVTRERIRQIAERTIKQTAINDSISKEIVIDPEILFEEEKKMRILAQNRRDELPPKPVKEKRWSKYYLACRSCGTAAIPHVRNGLCEQCAGGFRNSRRKQIIDQHENKCDSCGTTRREAITSYGRDLYITKDRRVLCRKCFLKTTGKNLGSYKNYAWSRFYPACKTCGTTEVPYSTAGFCINCDPKMSFARREKIISDAGSSCQSCGMDRMAAKRRYDYDLYITKSSDVLCKRCFQKKAKNVMRGDSRNGKSRTTYLMRKPS
jgi:hypothetical protein